MTDIPGITILIIVWGKPITSVFNYFSGPGFLHIVS